MLIFSDCKPRRFVNRLCRSSLFSIMMALSYSRDTSGREWRGEKSLILSFPGDAQAPVLRKAKDSLKLGPEATYLFVGDLGGLSRSNTKEFVISGVMNIAFLLRSGDTTAQTKAVVDELAGEGVQIRAYHGDIFDKTSFLVAMSSAHNSSRHSKELSR